MVLKQERNCEAFEKYIYSHLKKEQEFNIDIYRWCVYQVYGLLIQDLSKMKETAAIVKEGKIGWASPTYDCIRDKIAEFDEYLVNPFDVVEGVVECGKCGSKKTWSVQRQTRASDEPMTTFSRCVGCGNQWTYSG